MITIDDFKKVEIKIGTIVSAEKVEGADKLLKLLFDFGVTEIQPDSSLRGGSQADEAILVVGSTAPPPASAQGLGEVKQKPLTQILSGIAEFYDPSGLVGKQVPVIVNLEPRTLKGQVSNGMMLAVVVDGAPVLLHPDKDVPPGSLLR